MNDWELSILVMAPHDAVAETELGARPLVGLRRENFGLQRQRLEAISDRRYRDRGWRVEYGDDGMAARMHWQGMGGAEV